MKLREVKGSLVQLLVVRMRRERAASNPLLTLVLPEILWKAWKPVHSILVVVAARRA